MIWITILLMTAIVFFSRYFFLEPAIPLRLNQTTRRLLHYSSPAVLTAIWGPIVFSPQQTFWPSLENPYLIGAVVTGLLIWKTGNVLLTIGVSMGVFLLYNLVAVDYLFS
ncbi:AzlD domain-containing protein [Vibrio artabrorum]|uniref:AzlD domain-containing protein n=1 Tax=Vibrio artabrorum TaxID=446374 RepID=UPI0021C27C46|nr:AzlD domain-containing protein [Vibrio artabrorum]